MLQELRPGLATAEEQNNEPKACPLLWMYCHLLLLTGNVPGHSVQVSAFLALQRRLCSPFGAIMSYRRDFYVQS
jgi:hypothetical protein